MSVIIETTLGDIVVDLFVEERPTCCLNFLKLCKMKYYNYTLFHSVQRNFVAQAGDPTGTGRGGESIYLYLYGEQAKFFSAKSQPKIKHVKAGTLSMVNDGNGLHGSQFLLTLGENLDSLDDNHTVFGEIAEGMDVLMKINEVFCDKDHRPYQDIRITHTVIIDDPLDDPKGLQYPDKSPEPSKEQLEGCFRIGADEDINPDADIDPEELREREEQKEANHQAQVLELIGDIPDKDVRPPDNVLFVCKLNSITTDEDLEIIFSRFGKIISCEIIRDFKTGDSLQYAFVEFETPDMCEKAYHKMDNVLIDDRRIHVDFSQSVSKLKYPKVQVNKQTEKYLPKENGSSGKSNQSPMHSHSRSNKHSNESARSEYRDGDKDSRKKHKSKRMYYDHHHKSERDYSSERKLSKKEHKHSSSKSKKYESDSHTTKKSHRERSSDDTYRSDKKYKTKKRHKSDDYSDEEVRCGKHSRHSSSRKIHK